MFLIAKKKKKKERKKKPATKFGLHETPRRKDWHIPVCILTKHFQALYAELSQRPDRK